MSVPIIPVLRSSRRPWLERHPALRASFIVASLVLFVLAAAFPAEGRNRRSQPCHAIVAKEPLLRALVGPAKY